MTPRTRVAFLWHMHQPPYRDPQTGEPVLPWVRLHACRAYYDMARGLEEHPGVKATVNFVPSLVQQIEACVAGGAHDRFFALAAVPPAELLPAHRAYIVRHFFAVNWETGVRPLSRYWELLHARGRDVRGVNVDAVARALPDQDILDLTVLFHLAWFGWAATDEEPLLQELRKKGRGYTPEERQAVLDLSLRVAGKVVPLWRKLSERGQVEITATPFYHPILPLLCDTDSARRALPDLPLPARFAWPQDARAQVRRALDFHAERFGARPRGMWPAEGSVSPEAAEVFAAEGVQWIASDEDVLLRSLPDSARREDALYRPWRLQTGAGPISLAFRDQPLSDLIGFTYAKNPAESSARDFIHHLEAIGRGAHPLVTVALDGENPWEHYPDSGRDFLRALYRQLESGRGAATVRLGDALAEHDGAGSLSRLHSGSWIDASFRIWIGHPEDNAAWELLGAARRELESASHKGASAAALADAREALFAAEASDWFWWYGDDFHTDNAAEFDALFRGHVRACYLALGLPPPARLDWPIARRARERERPVREPQGFITPRVDGKAVHYFDWAGAGIYRPGQGGAHGADSMHRGGAFFDTLHWGFDLTHLYLRLDPASGASAAAQAPTEVKIVLSAPEREVAVALAVARGELEPRLGEERVGRAVFDEVLELEIPWSRLGMGRGEPLGLCVRLEREGVELERLPHYGHLSVIVPTEDFEQVHWKV